MSNEEWKLQKQMTLQERVVLMLLQTFSMVQQQVESIKTSDFPLWKYMNLTWMKQSFNKQTNKTDVVFLYVSGTNLNSTVTY